MPEGDKYDRAMPKGYRRAFRYLRNNADADTCDRQFLISVRDDTEAASILTILRAGRPHLKIALSSQQTLLETIAKRDFKSAMDRLKVQHNNSTSVLKAVDILESVFHRLQQSGSCELEQELSQGLFEYCVSRLLDLGRPALMQDLGHSSEEHEQWRSDLLARLRPDGRTLFAPCFGKDKAKPRMARRKKPLAASTAEQLQQEVPVR